MKKVLAITPTLEHASFHQRIGMFVEPLKSLGYAVETVRYPDFGSRRALIRRSSEFDLVWLRRKTVEVFTARALRQSPVPLVYDCDDAVFVRSRPKNGSWRSGIRISLACLEAPRTRPIQKPVSWSLILDRG